MKVTKKLNSDEIDPQDNSRDRKPKKISKPLSPKQDKEKPNHTD